jgi:hypothetical protein
MSIASNNCCGSGRLSGPALLKWSKTGQAGHFPMHAKYPGLIHPTPTFEKAYFEICSQSGPQQHGAHVRSCCQRTIPGMCPDSCLHLHTITTQIAGIYSYYTDKLQTGSSAAFMTAGTASVVHVLHNHMRLDSTMSHQ